MRLFFTFSISIALLSTAYAQSEASLIADLPSCALTCVLKYLPDTTCAATDFQCMCSTPQLWTNTTNCVIPSCTVTEALTAKNISAQICHTPVRDRTLKIQLTGPILCLLAIIFVTVRVVARQPFVSDLFGWDDGLIVVAAVLAVPVAVIQVYSGHFGMGKDVWTIPTDHVTKVLQLLFVGEIFYTVTTTLTRTSILVFYLRVFTSHKFQIAAKSLISINLAFWVATIFPIIFQCSPISYAWTRWSEETKGKCINVNVGVWTNAAMGILLDLAVLVLPLPSLYQLQLNYSWTKKFRVFIMFSVGLVATTVSIVRLRTLIYVKGTHNPTWDLVGVSIWSVVESKTGIICACLPMAKVFFTRLAPQWLGMTVAASTRNVPTPGAGDPGGRWTSSTSGTESTHRLSKPPQRTSVVVTTIPEGSEEGDSTELMDVKSNKSLEHRIGIAK